MPFARPASVVAGRDQVLLLGASIPCHGKAREAVYDSLAAEAFSPVVLVARERVTGQLELREYICTNAKFMKTRRIMIKTLIGSIRPFPHDVPPVTQPPAPEQSFF